MNCVYIYCTVPDAFAAGWPLGHRFAHLNLSLVLVDHHQYCVGWCVCAKETSIVINIKVQFADTQLISTKWSVTRSVRAAAIRGPVSAFGALVAWRALVLLLSFAFYLVPVADEIGEQLLLVNLTALILSVCLCVCFC